MSVLLGVAHGSRDDGAQEVVRSLLRSVSAYRPGLRAEAAYVDNVGPSVAGALAALTAEGVRDVVVLPLLLTAASHSKTDLPGSVQAGRLAHPGLRLRYGRPLGPHPLLVEVLAQRLAEAGAGPGDPVVLVAGGSLDPDANAQVAATARLLWEGRDFPCVEVAFASATRPSVSEALERLRALGHRRAVVARYFLGPGRLPDAVAAAASGVRGLEVVVTAPVGMAAPVAELVLERYDEARRAAAVMNCDCCLYRTPFPGRTAAVGTPQAPHRHPWD